MKYFDIISALLILSLPLFFNWRYNIGCLSLIKEISFLREFLYINMLLIGLFT